MGTIFNRRTLLTGAAAMGAGSLTLLAGRGGQVPPMALAQEAAANALTAAMVKGEADAPVTVIEYTSFSCPHCARFHQSVYPRIEEAYIDEGLVRFEKREVYFDRPSLWAAMLARCGDGTRYWGIIDLIYARQADWSRAGTAQEVVAQLARIGAQAGLSEEQVGACLSDGAMAEGLVAQYEAHQQDYAIRGTPTFVVNGTVHSNMNFADFSAIIDEALEG